jgi:hypothetical protein
VERIERAVNHRHLLAVLPELVERQNHRPVAACVESCEAPETCAPMKHGKSSGS